MAGPYRSAPKAAGPSGPSLQLVRIAGGNLIGCVLILGTIVPFAVGPFVMPALLRALAVHSGLAARLVAERLEIAAGLVGGLVLTLALVVLLAALRQRIIRRHIAHVGSVLELEVSHRAQEFRLRGTARRRAVRVVFNPGAKRVRRLASVALQTSLTHGWLACSEMWQHEHAVSTRTRELHPGLDLPEALQPLGTDEPAVAEVVQASDLAWAQRVAGDERAREALEGLLAHHDTGDVAVVVTQRWLVLHRMHGEIAATNAESVEQWIAGLSRLAERMEELAAS